MPATPSQLAQVLQETTLTLPVSLPSQNQLRGYAGGRLGRFPATSWRRRFERELVPLLRSARCRGPAELEIVRLIGPRQRPYDADNLTGGCKPLIDALRLHGYILDDCPEMLTLKVWQRSPGDGERAPAILIHIRRRPC